MNSTSQSPFSRIARVALPLCVLLAAAAISGCITSPKSPDEAAAAQMQVATKYASEGLEKQRAGKIDEAIELYRKSLASNDKISGVWTNLGLAMRDKQNFVDAAKAFQRAADLSPQDPRPLAYLGVLYLERNWNREALDNFEAALNRDSMNQDALRGAVQASQRLGKRDERTLEIVKKLLLVENDPKWRTEMELRKVGLEQHLAELARETKK